MDNNLKTESNGQSVSSVGKSNTKLQLIVGILVLILSVLIIAVLLSENKRPPQSIEPTRTDFGVALSPEFPTNIPIEPNTEISQSYNLQYDNEKQHTTVFASTASVAANYTAYTDFLTTEDWTILNTYESETISSIYAAKDNDEMNVTINTTNLAVDGSTISISVLKK